MLRKLPLSRAPYGQHMQKRPHVCSGPSEEQPDAFLTRRIHATPLEDLSSQSPCCWLQPPIYKMKRVKSVNVAATSAAMTWQAWLLRRPMARSSPFTSPGLQAGEMREMEVVTLESPQSSKFECVNGIGECAFLQVH